MATLYSNTAHEAAKLFGTRGVSPRESEGKLRVTGWEINLAAIRNSLVDDTNPTQTAAQNDVAHLCRIPEGSRILRIVYIKDATWGATATPEYGLAGADGSGFYTGSTADDPDFFRTASTDTSANTEVVLAYTKTTTGAVVGRFGYTTTKDVVLTCTFTAAAPPTSGNWSGYVIYATA